MWLSFLTTSLISYNFIMFFSIKQGTHAINVCECSKLTKQEKAKVRLEFLEKNEII